MSLVECVNAGIDDQKYILITVLRENINKLLEFISSLFHKALRL